MNEILNIRGGKMKKVLAIVAIAVLAMLLAPARTTTVHVVRYIPAGGTVWGAVESAMAETGDTRPVDEVMYYTRQLNPTINAGLVQPGTRIIVPCQARRQKGKEVHNDQQRTVTE